MKYKVWGKTKAVLIPKKHHFEAVLVIAFMALLVAAIFAAVRLGTLYSGTFYSGVTEPYLQMLGSDRVTIRWQSEDRVIAAVEVINSVTNERVSKKEKNKHKTHEITIESLQPDTRYKYRLLHDGDVFRQGNDYWFITAPAVGESKPVRLWILGDPGRAGNAIEVVKSSAKKWIDSNPREGKQALDLVITTGDNAYENGARQEFEDNFFSVWKEYSKNYNIWPVYGNHDARGWSFFKLFSFPENAELGGEASSTEAYYSFDYANIHLVFLDSNEGAYTEDDNMLRWLKRDLTLSKQKWLVVFMHHPAYTRGSHNSNSARDSGSRMFNMRKRVLPILEKSGVDLVIAGHSHSYERSHLINCHYGLSSDFRQTSVLQSGSDFMKPAIHTSYSGTLYVVIGSSAEAIDGKFDHPALPVSNAELGSMIIDIENDVLTARFIDYQSSVLDEFTLSKSDKMDTSLLKRHCR